MQYLVIPLLIILAIGAATSNLDLPGFDFPDVLSGLGWGTSAPSPQGTSLLQNVQPTNPLLNTFITDGPVNNSTFLTSSTATLGFSGTGPSGTANGLTFETFVEGFDQSWVSTAEQSRTVTLPGGVKTYRFLVRSKLANAVDPTPASRIFKIQVSPYFGKVNIGSIQAPSSYQQGIITLQAYSLGQNESVSVSGWKFQGRSEDFVIPKGVATYLPSGPNPREDIRLQSSGRVFIVQGANPLVQGMAFRPNQCFGYFTQTRAFPVSVPSSCPDFPVQRSSISYLSPTCQDYITQLPYCKKPNYSGNSAVASNQECRDYLDTHLTYETCLQGNQNNSYFFSNEWHVYTEDDRFLRPGHDQILLYDSNNLFVTTYDY